MLDPVASRLPTWPRPLACGLYAAEQDRAGCCGTEHRRDRFQRHATVERLSGQGVPQLVGMDVRQPCGGNVVEDPGDRVCVRPAALLPGQQQGMIRRDLRAAVVVDELDEVRVQWQVAGSGSGGPS